MDDMTFEQRGVHGGSLTSVNSATTISTTDSSSSSGVNHQVTIPSSLRSILPLCPLIQIFCPLIQMYASGSVIYFEFRRFWLCSVIQISTLLVSYVIRNFRRLALSVISNISAPDFAARYNFRRFSFSIFYFKILLIFNVPLFQISALLVSSVISNFNASGSVRIFQISAARCGFSRYN